MGVRGKAREAEGEHQEQRKGNCWCASREEQVEQHQPTGRQQRAKRQQEEEHLLSRVAMRAGNQWWKGQAIQREQEQWGCKRQEKLTPALRFP